MEYKIATTIEEIEQYLNGSKVVAFDFETSPLEEYRNEPMSALDPHKAEITGVSFSVKENTAIYVPFGHKQGKNAELSSILSYLKSRLFKNPDIIKIAHNLAYEAMFLYKHGIVVQEPVYDTIVASQLTIKNHYEFRNLGDSGLKTLVPQLYNEELPKFLEVVGDRSFDALDSEDWDTIRYACADSDYTLRLYHTFNEWFDEYMPKHRELCEKIESPTAIYAGIMKYNGVGVDVDSMLSKQVDADNKIAELKEEIQFIIGDVEIGSNCGTNAFKNYLYKSLGLPVLKTTAKYADAADDETMQRLTEYCKTNRPELVQLFELVQEYRKWAKIKSTYLDGYLKWKNSKTNRLHPNFYPMGATTGRFTCNKPNIQTQVQPNKDPIGVRNFIVPRKGYVLVEGDYSQVELRIAAYVTQDSKMLNAYKEGLDIHAITTSAVFNIPLEEAKDKHHKDYKRRRTVAKSTMFGILYGIYGKGLARNLKYSAGVDIAEQEASEYIRNIKNGYSDLSSWQQEIVKQARTNKYVETALGRRRYLAGINSMSFATKSGAERMALNTPIQGLAADCLKLAMARLVKAIADKEYIRPIMTVHDSLVFEVKEERLEESMKLIQTCMEQKPPVDNFDLDLVVDMAHGYRYGEIE